MDQPLLCLIDDDLEHRQVMQKFLSADGFRVVTFSSATEYLNQHKDAAAYDLVISDINMPGLCGFDLCRALRAVAEPVRTPIILITGGDPLDHPKGIEAGADDFISKPVAMRHLLAKIRSLLAIRAQEQQRLHELESSKGLNAKLGRFLSPNIASRLTKEDAQILLQPHRAEVSVLFVDIRRFTAFSEKAEPETVLEVLKQYYAAVGTAAMHNKGTLGHLAGDGIMIFFNDPEPLENHSEAALLTALQAREALREQKKLWHARQYDIDFGMGLSKGVATIGGIGFDDFFHYSVIGNVANFSARLCQAAIDGQILVAEDFLRDSKLHCQVESIGTVNLRGIKKQVCLYNVLSLAEALKSAV